MSNRPTLRMRKLKLREVQRLAQAIPATAEELGFEAASGNSRSYTPSNCKVAKFNQETSSSSSSQPPPSPCNLASLPLALSPVLSSMRLPVS